MILLIILFILFILIVGLLNAFISLAKAKTFQENEIKRGN